MPTLTSKTPEHVRIVFKKGGEKPDSALITRFDKSEVFIQYQSHPIFHDLAHYAIESALMIRAGFYWMVNQGLTSADFELPKDEQPALLTKAMKDPNHVAIEFIANQLMIEGTNSGKIDNFVELLEQSMADKGAQRHTFRFDEVILDDIRELYAMILEGWKMFPEGKEKKVVIHYPGAGDVILDDD